MTPAEQIDKIKEAHAEYCRLAYSSDGANFPRYRVLMRELALSVGVLLARNEWLEARVKELEAKQ